MLLKVGKKGRVREVLQARSVVRHDIVRSWEVEVHRAVPVLALEGAAVVAEVGWSSVAGDSALSHARDGWGVVCAIGDGSVA